MKNYIQRLKYKTRILTRLPAYLVWRSCGGKQGPLKWLVYIIENANWSIKWDGYYIIKEMKLRGAVCKLDVSPRYYFNSIIHFGSVHTYVNADLYTVSNSNKLIMTIFHGDKDINPQMDTTLDRFLANHERLFRIVVTNTIMRKRLISWGIRAEKIVLIPLGVDLSNFKPATIVKRNELRRQLGIPEGAICIGSFQKDGNGWGEGLVPKWIKGPDIFVEAITLLAKKHKVHCLLTGPARGYVKRGLESAGIPFTHHFPDNYLDIVDYYNCLDLYIVTSREEGGPKAIMESMATGVPLVSTSVGMAPDVIQDGVNAFLVNIEDVKGIVNKSETVLSEKEIRDKITNNGLETAKRYDWNIIVREYAKLYKEALESK